MYLNDITIHNLSERLHKLEETLKVDFGVDISMYYNLTETEITQFLEDLHQRRKIIINESGFSEQFQNPEYIKATLLHEACKLMLVEIHPKRKKPRKIKMDESFEDILSQNDENIISVDFSLEDDDCDYKINMDGTKSVLGNNQLTVDHDDLQMKRIIAVYEDKNNMTSPVNDKIEKLGNLLENALLMEGELERAELVLAMKDVVGRMQKMLEDVGKMGTDDIMPLSDGLRTYYGETVAESFSQQAEASLQALADSIQNFKDVFDTQSIELEQRISDEDAEQPMDDLSTTIDNDSNDNNNPIADIEVDDTGDIEADIDAAIGDVNVDVEPEEPLGRARKESVKNNKLPIKEHTSSLIVKIAGKRVKVTEHQAKSLMFAKKFYEKTSMMGAKSVRLNESQGTMIETAKRIMKKLTEGKK